MTTLRAISLLGATITTGLLAGVFAVFAHTIMPALRGTDDRTFVAAFRSIDRAIINPWFMTTAFLGAPVLTAAATALNLGRAALPWIAVALALHAASFVVTVTVNVPLNDTIKTAGNPDHIRDLAGVRKRFDETRWAAWNLVRCLTSTGALCGLVWALVLYGRSTA
jgi:uncharacterized membrane protein